LSRTLKYFAYGSNLHPMRLVQRTPSCRLLGAATLPGYRLAFNKRGADASGKCNIVRPTQGDHAVHGALYLIEASDRPALDRAEGGYRVQRCLVHAGSQAHEAFTYVARDESIDEGLVPYHWYHALVMAGARYQRLPSAYLGMLEAWWRVPDPDPARARRNAQLLARIEAGPAG